MRIETESLEILPDMPALLDVHATARILSMSARNLYRLVDAGKMPRPLKIGGKNLWRRDVLERWIAADCPSTHDKKW
jgi:predicted DNA-binding transcriptional regulator AlpA